MDMSLLDAAYTDSQDNIQLEAAYKAFQDGTGNVEQAHLFKKNKIKLQEIRSVGLNGSERIFVTKTIFQLLKNMIRLEAPVPTILVSIKRQKRD